MKGGDIEFLYINQKTANIWFCGNGAKNSWRLFLI